MSNVVKFASGVSVDEGRSQQGDLPHHLESFSFFVGAPKKKALSLKGRQQTGYSSGHENWSKKKCKSLGPKCVLQSRNPVLGPAYRVHHRTRHWQGRRRDTVPHADSGYRDEGVHHI